MMQRNAIAILALAALFATAGLWIGLREPVGRTLPMSVFALGIALLLGLVAARLEVRARKAVA